MIGIIKALLLVTISVFVLLVFHTYNFLMQTILMLIALLLYFTYCFCNLIENDRFDENDEFLDNNLDENNDIAEANDRIEENNEIVDNNQDGYNTPQLVIKVSNLSDLNNNYNTECCICLETIDPLTSFKLLVCNYHIFHKECLNIYLKNNFKKCPICR